jgi:hypothetical protein
MRTGSWIGPVAAMVFCAASPALAQTETLTVSGTLTDEGVECRAMRGEDGKLYTLAPRSAATRFPSGTKIRVTGTVAVISFCQQGTTIQVRSVTAIE